MRLETSSEGAAVIRSNSAVDDAVAALRTGGLFGAPTRAPPPPLNSGEVTAMRLETSSEGAAVIRSIHDISNANVTSPLLSGGGTRRG
jgi:hypothetical protein